MKRSLVTFSMVLILFSQAQGFCGSRLLQTSLTRGAFRAADWLRKQQDENGTYGEGHVSAIVFHSLRLIGDHVDNGSEHLNAEIIKNKLGSINGGRLAYYILGAMSTCRDPKNFYNFNLVRALQTKLAKYPQPAEFSHPFQYSLAVLALCSSGENLEKKRKAFVEKITDSILSNQTADDTTAMSDDTIAMQVLALSCIRESLKSGKRIKETKNERSSVELAIKRASKKILKRQMNDSSFGENEVTAALSAQALLAAGVMTTKCPETMGWLLSRQNPDGSFINLLSTINVLPTLIGAMPYDVQHIACSERKTSGFTGEDEETKEMINVCVELQIDEHSPPKQLNQAENQIPQKPTPTSLPPPACVEVQNGTKAHDILKEAAKQHACYDFTTLSTSFGRMITSICEVEQKPAEKFYWMIYINDKRAPVGMDDLQPKNGSTLRFHYKKLNWG